MFDKIIQFFFEGLQETFKIFAIQLFAVSIVKFWVFFGNPNHTSAWGGDPIDSIDLDDKISTSPKSLKMQRIL